MKKFLITTDVETTSLVNHCLSDETGKFVAEKAIPVTLELYRKYKIYSTFFITGYFASKFPDAVKMIYDAGHEVGCHAYSHEHDRGFDQLTLEDQISDLMKAKSILESVINDEVISFRAPALRTNEYTVEALETCGFIIDSSISSQRFDFLMSLGSAKKLKWLFSPHQPYYADKNALYRRGDSKILEIPVTAFILPYIGTTLRILPLFMNAYKNLFLGRETLNFLIHPIELVMEENRNTGINRRSKNYFKYLLSDVLRHKLKIKNIGDDAVRLLEKQITYFQKRGYEFITCKELLKRKIHGKTT